MWVLAWASMWVATPAMAAPAAPAALAWEDREWEAMHPQGSYLHLLCQSAGHRLPQIQQKEELGLEALAQAALEGMVEQAASAEMPRAALTSELALEA